MPEYTDNVTDIMYTYIFLTHESRRDRSVFSSENCPSGPEIDPESANLGALKKLFQGAPGSSRELLTRARLESALFVFWRYF